MFIEKMKCAIEAPSERHTAPEYIEGVDWREVFACRFYGALKSNQTYDYKHFTPNGVGANTLQKRKCHFESRIRNEKSAVQQVPCGLSLVAARLGMTFSHHQKWL